MAEMTDRMNKTNRANKTNKTNKTETTGIQLVMPMAGRGSRFSGEGFSHPKPLIEIHGKPFFWWAVRSLEKYVTCAGITFVVLEEHVRDHGIDREILRYFPQARIVALPEVTEGAAVTAHPGIEGLGPDEPVLFNDCDHLFRSSDFNEFCSVSEAIRYSFDNPECIKSCGSPQSSGGGHTEVPDGALLTFESSSPAYSYLQYSSDGKVCGTVEKQAVSHDAICGAYYFRSRAVFEKACGDYFAQCSYKEYFLSGVYNTLLASGGNVAGFRTDFHLPFGTPEEYKTAAEPENRKYFEELQ